MSTEHTILNTDFTTRISFSRAARDYDTHALLQRSVCDRMATILSPYLRPQARILDAGCGTGYFAQQQLTPHLIQIDSAEGMAQQAAVHAPVLCADMHRLPFAANQFDAYASSLCLQWASDRARVFAECWRVLKPGGIAVFTTLGPATLQELKQAYLDAGLPVHVVSFVPLHQLDEEVTQCGFDLLLLKQEKRPLYFDTPLTLLRHLKGLGATYRANGGGLHGRHYLRRLEHALQARYPEEIPASFEVFYLLMEKPLHTQETSS